MCLYIINNENTRESLEKLETAKFDLCHTTVCVAQTVSRSTKLLLSIVRAIRSDGGLTSETSALNLFTVGDLLH